MKRTGNGKIAVVGWGRGMGHTGHMYLADAVITQARDMKADAYFFVSKTVGKDDPLFPEEKIKIYQRVFPQQANIFSAQGNLNDALKEIAQMGYQGVVVVVGADQKQSFGYLERPTKEGIPAYQSFGLKKLRVISRQETRSKFAGEEGPRATPMREILLSPTASEQEKFAVWRRDMPEALSDEEVQDLMRKAEQRLMTSNKTKKLKEFIERVKPMMSSMTTEQRQKVYSLLETALKDKQDLDAKRKALDDMEREPGHDKEAIRQRKLDLEKEARNKNVSEGSDERKQNALWAQITAHEKAAKKSKDLKQQHHLKMANQLRSQLKTSDTEGSLNEFAPDEGSGGRKFIPWTEFIEQLKQILHKDFDCKENIVKSTIKARFVPHDPMEYGPTMLYSYYETRAGGRNKGAVSTRGSIQVGKYTGGGFTGQIEGKLLTTFSLLKGHPFERHFDLTFDNIYKIANIIQGNTQGALEFKPEQQVNEFAPSDDGDNGQEDMFFKYAKLWYNGNLQVQQRIEETLAQAGWEIGELESEEGGVFIVQSGDENGDTYMGWSAEDLGGQLNEFAPNDGGDSRVPMHFVVEKELYNPRSKWKKSYNPEGGGVLLFTTKEEAIQAAEKFNRIDKNREFKYGGTQMAQVDDENLNEFAPGNGDDGLPYAEYQVYQCNPLDQFDWIGGPLYQTDSMGMAHKYAYEQYVKHRPKAFMIWQERSQGSRGNYGVKGLSDGSEDIQESGISRRGILKGLGAAMAAGAAGKASAIAGAFPTPSHQQAMYAAAAQSNRAQAAELQRQNNAARAAKLDAATKDIERLNKINFHGGKVTPINATWDGDSDFMDVDGTKYAMASRMPIRGNEPGNMKLVSTREGHQVYMWTRNSLKGVVGRYFYPAPVNEDLSPEQEKAGQLGPTEKVKNNNIGKLVGENLDYLDEK